MPVSVSMPQLGESVTEGTVTRWLKQEGEHVEADEPLLEVSTDKVDTEIPSPVSGVLRGIKVGRGRDRRRGRRARQSSTRTARRRRAAPPRQRPCTAAAAAAPACAARPAQQARRSAARRAATHRLQPPRPRRPVNQQPSQLAAARRPGRPPQLRPPRARRPARRSRRRRAAYQARRGLPAAGYEGRQRPGRRAGQFTDAADGPYVTPLVRKLAAEHGIDLADGDRHRRRRPDPQAGHPRMRPRSSAGRGS